MHVYYIISWSTRLVYNLLPSINLVLILGNCNMHVGSKSNKLFNLINFRPTTSCKITAESSSLPVTQPLPMVTSYTNTEHFQNQEIDLVRIKLFALHILLRSHPVSPAHIFIVHNSKTFYHTYRFM